MQKQKIGVVFGGMSTEHDVSIVSATYVIKNLNTEKYEIFPIYISKEGKWFYYKKKVENIETLNEKDIEGNIEEIKEITTFLENLDVVFPVLHGLYGEDGTIQGMLKLLGKKYVGCGVLASSICMDKAYTKVIFEHAKIEQAKYIYIKNEKNGCIYVDNFEEKPINVDNLCELVENYLHFPVFVKPSNSGSSVGINKSHNKEELEKHIKEASKYDTKVLIEETICGREVECAVLGNEEVKASCVGEIIPAEEFYTFDAKYQNAESKVLIPANLPEEIENKIRQIAVKAFKAVDGKGLSRVDFFVEKDTNRIIINEINTLPGFTQISMYPKLWEKSGVPYTKLLDELINLATK